MALKKEQEIATKIRDSYVTKPTEKTKLEQLRELDQKVKRPVNIFSYVLGTTGALVMGTGMCMTMGFLGGLMPVGIAVGLVGMGIAAATYPLHKKILASRKEKYSKQIIAKSNEIINENNAQNNLNCQAFSSQKQNTNQSTVENNNTQHLQSNQNSNDNGMEL